MTLWKWSQTAATNASADSTINWAEGMAPSAVDDSARAVMAAVAKWRDDIGGTLGTAGGPTAFTIATTNQNFATFASPPPNGTSITFVMNQTNAASATLSIDGGTAYPLRTDTATAAPAGILTANAAYSATFKTSVNAWVLNNLYNIGAGIAPIGSITPYAGVGDPSANFLICDGRSLVRATYVYLFQTVWANTALFGSADGSHFNLPDLRGRVIAGIDGTGLLTTATIANNPITGNQFGATGGTQNHSISIGEMPTHNHSGSTVSDSGHAHNLNVSTVLITTGGVGINVPNSAGTPTANLVASGNAVVSPSIANQGSGTAMALIQPTMMLSYLIRVLLMSLLGRLSIGLGAVLIGIALLRLGDFSDVSSQPLPCMSAEDRETLRSLALDAIDQAYKQQVIHLFDVWMKDASEQPKRASVGMQTAISAHVRARALSLNWNPPKCS